jgi:heme/copper-type cytochrome/quinol oxidase subunit 2
LADLIFWLAVVCCVVAQAAIVRAALRTPVHHAEPGMEVPRPRRAIEIGWTVLPAIGLALVLLMTWRAIHRPVAPSQPPIMLERAPRGQ